MVCYITITGVQKHKHIKMIPLVKFFKLIENVRTVCEFVVITVFWKSGTKPEFMCSKQHCVTLVEVDSKWEP